MRKFLILVWISLFYYASAIYGQNMAAGNPFLSDADLTTLAAKELDVSLTFRNAYSFQYYNGFKAYNGSDFIKSACSNYVEFKTAYGCTPKISASVELGYFFNKTIQYKDSSHNGNGLGDLAVQFKYRLYFNKAAGFTLLPSVGIKLPIGVFDQTKENVKLPISVQPSSGSLKYIFSIYMSKVMNEKLSISSLCSYEYAQLIDSDNFYYRYGDQFIFSFYANYKFSEKLVATLQCRFESKDKSHIEFSKIVEASGYKIIFVSPQISYNFSNNWQFSVYADLPAYRYYNRIQLAASYAVSLKLLKKLDF